MGFFRIIWYAFLIGLVIGLIQSLPALGLLLRQNNETC